MSFPAAQFESINSLALSLYMVQLSYQWASLVAQMIKNLPTIWETQIHALVWEDVLENLTLNLFFFLWQGVATHSSILAWRIPRTEKLQAIVHGITKSWT